MRIYENRGNIGKPTDRAARISCQSSVIVRLCNSGAKSQRGIRGSTDVGECHVVRARLPLKRKRAIVYSAKSSGRSTAWYAVRDRIIVDGLS